MTLAWIIAAAAPGLPPWGWALGGAVLGAGLALLVARRRAGGGAGGADHVWQALGQDPPATGPGEEDWQAVLTEVEQAREAAIRGQRLQLELTMAQAERVLLDSVLDAMLDGIVVLDRSECVLYANQMARRMLGFGDEPNPTLDQARADPKLLRGVRSVLVADLARKIKSCRVQWQEDDEERTYVIRCLMSEAVPGAQTADDFVVMFEDLTAEEHAARAKSEFIYGVSHELKTPLTSIQASLEMLVDDDGLPAEEREKLTRLAHGESVRLGRMVHELLDLARVEAGITEFKYEKVEMAEVLDGLHDLHVPLAERQGISLSWSVSDYMSTFTGDPRLVRQAFINLIGNAIKYTKRSGQVSVSAGLEGNELVIRIQDTGIGIAPEDVPRIFQKFFRAGTAQDSRVQGTGLGLPMARYIIERHHGRIEVSSEVGVGTEFVVFLPVGQSDPDSEGVESAFLAVDGAR